MQPFFLNWGPASASAAGVVTTGTQAFAGQKDLGSTFRVTGYANPASGVGMEMEYGQVASTGSIRAYDRTGASYQNLLLNNLLNVYGAATVGVGTIANNGCKMDVNGTVRAIGVTTPTGGAGIEMSYSASQGLLRAYDWTGAAFKQLIIRGLSIAADQGNFLIGSQTDNGCKLDVSGTVRATGSTAPTAGIGVEMLYAGGGLILSYDRGGSVYKTLAVNALSIALQPSGVATLTADGTNNINAKPSVLASYTLATLPTASASTRGLIWVSDMTGGAQPAYSDGTNWRRTQDATVAS